MDIEIERLSVELGGDIAAERGQRIGDLLDGALERELARHAGALGAAAAGYRVAEVALPAVRVQAGATDDEIAELVANEVVRAVLRGLEGR